MDRTGARGLPRICARVALIIAAFLLLVPAFGQAASLTLEWVANNSEIEKISEEMVKIVTQK